MPTTSIAVQETLPTGRYDRLGDRPSDGFGGGAYTTTLALYSQTYFWLSNGRILRMRFNASYALSGHADVTDVSVYGTGEGFRGRARPGSSLFLDAAWEYSLTRKWVLALDVTYRYDASTRVTGYDVLGSARSGIRMCIDRREKRLGGSLRSKDALFRARIDQFIGCAEESLRA